MTIACKKTETQDFVTYLFDASIVTAQEIKEFLGSENSKGHFSNKQVAVLVDNLSEEEVKDIQLDLYTRHYGPSAANDLKEITFADDEKLRVHELMSIADHTCGPSNSCGGGRAMFNL